MIIVEHDEDTGTAPDQPEQDAEQRFAIHDEATATWALGTINTARAQLRYREEAAAAWVEEAVREVARLEARFLPELRAWGLQNLPAGRKTIKLLSGRLEYRNKPGRFTLVDPEVALPWAKTHLPSAVVVKESVAAEVLIRYAKETGETPDGLTWIPEQANETFSAK